MSLSFDSELRMAIKTGKVKFGSKEALKASKLGKAKLIVVAENTPKEIKDDIVYYAKLSNIPVYIYKGTSIELGTLCGKPFTVAAIAIYDVGESRILELLEEGDGESA